MRNLRLQLQAESWRTIHGIAGKEPYVPPEWTAYSCNIPNADAFRQGDCVEFVDVHHVAHVSQAFRIFEDGKIRAGLVFDDSRLNTTRTSVSWLSPNTWGLGSIYGTVQFTFAWSDILADRTIYWVEAMTQYNPTAYRFLLTRDQANPLGLTLYDPTVAAGPLRRNAAGWFRNGNYTGEFMVDSDIPLERCRRVKFISHHQEICRTWRATCQERWQDVNLTGAMILAHILARQLHFVDAALLESDGQNAGRPTDEVDSALARLATVLGSNSNFGGTVGANIADEALLAALLCLTARHTQAARLF